MLLKTSIDKKLKEIEIKNRCGDAFSLFHKIKYQFYGSPKYKIKSIYPDTIYFQKSNDIINCNIELRIKGIVLYFRFKQDEYAICGRFNQTVFQSSNNIFDIQIGNNRVTTEIQDTKAHQKFLKHFFTLKNNNTHE